jgi:hypothetical protein
VKIHFFYRFQLNVIATDPPGLSATGTLTISVNRNFKKIQMYTMKKMATFTEVVKDHTSNKNNTDVSDSSQ